MVCIVCLLLFFLKKIFPRKTDGGPAGDKDVLLFPSSHDLTSNRHLYMIILICFFYIIIMFIYIFVLFYRKSDKVLINKSFC